MSKQKTGSTWTETPKTKPSKNGTPEPVEQKAPATALDKVCSVLVGLQRQRTIIMKSRIMQANRLQAVVAGTIGYTSTMSEADRARLFKEASDLISKVRDGEADHILKGVILTTMKGIDEFNLLQEQLEKEMLVSVKGLPVLGWMEKPEQRGFGLPSLGVVIGECGNLSGYANPAKVWRRLGCAPWTFQDVTHMGSTWRYGKEGKLPASEWEQYGYSPRRRSIMYVVGEGLVKLNGKDSEATADLKKQKGRKASIRLKDGPYRVRYEEAKAKAKVNHPDWTDKRRHMHGMLLACKLLLKELWCEWHGRPEGGWEYEQHNQYD